MFEHLDDPNPPVPGPHERGRVMARAQELVGRRRLLTGLGIAVAVAVIALVPAVARNNGGGRSLHAAGEPAANTAPDAVPGTVSPTPGAPVSVLGTQFNATTTTVAGALPVIAGAAPPRPASAAAPPPTSAGTPAPPVCRNSTNPACGDFYWDPNPGDNKPIAWELTYSPSSPRAGDKVTFHLVATDPDGGTPQTCNFSFGASQGEVVCDRYLHVPCPTRYGPWTPPAAKEGTQDELQDHTYDNPGTYDVFFDVDTGRDCDSPYASQNTLKTRVTVSDASPLPPAAPAP